MNISLLERFSAKLDPIVRQQGAKILAAKRYTILESDSLSCLAKVTSDSLPEQEYSIRIMEANNLLTASCTCQFYQENGLCKHISAIVSHLIIQKATNETGYNGSSGHVFQPADIHLPYVGITKEFVTAHSSPHYISLSQKALGKNVGRPVTVKEKWKGHVVCEVADGETYWRHLHVVIDLRDELLHLSCTCSQNKAALCSHKVSALHYLSEGYTQPDVLLSFPAKEKLLKEALKPYGFSPEDQDIDKLFRMETDVNGNYIAIPLQKGIVKTTFFDTTLKSALQLHTALSLPVEEVATDKDKKADTGYAYLICPSEQRYGLGHLPSIFTLCGTFNKDRTELVRNIFHKGEAYEKGHTLPLPTSNQQAIEEILGQLQEKSISKYAKKQNEGLESSQVVAHYVCDHLVKLLPLLQEEVVYFSDSEYFSKSSLDKVTISPEKPELRFHLSHKPPFLCLKGQVFLYDKPVSNKQDNYFYYYFLKGSQLLFFESAVDVLYTHQFLQESEIKVHASNEDGFLREVALPLSKKYPMTFELSKPVQKGEASGFRVAVYLSEQGNFMLIRPVAEYDQGTVDLFSEELLLKQEEGIYFQYDRNKEAEKALRELLTAMHPDFPKQKDRGFFYVHFDKLMDDGWYFQFFQQLKDTDITVFGLEKIKKARFSPHRPSIKTRIGSGIDWFDVSIEISFGEQSVSLKEVQKALLRKENYVVLNDGTKGLLPLEWLEKHAALIRSGTVDKKGDLKLSKMHFNLLDELLEEVDQEEILQEIREKKQKLLSFEGIRQHEIPPTIQAELRHYQVSGFDWLMFLDEFGWGGCLADDMGLGKTLQVITFLKRQTELHPDKPNLVVLPTSLLFNWKNELRKFAPDLTYLDYTGPQRNKQRTNFAHYHLVLTTYGLIINDIERLRKVPFNYVVLDESQAVKNPDSQRYKAVCLLQARNKLVMTGTPIENNTFDLFAQMNFVNPGLLGSMGHFQSHFSTPIDKFGDQEAAVSLRKIISPFLLRRTKEQVAPELPDKTEDVLFCEMGAEQRKVYNAFRDNYRQMIAGKIEQEGLGKSSMIVLDALLKLRQICNSPALLNTEEQYGNDSIKLQELLEHLTEKTGQHKVLVFSQFTQMLKLVEDELGKTGLAYEYLDGQTPAAQREAKVARFQSDVSVRIFLISLKAGGVGLNLTEADYVYLIDPWWNPAVEAQAIDRTHRIGQSKKVFAYRMICKDTIEEKVLQLQERKRKVAEDLISTEAAFFKQLDKDDIMELFS